MNWYCEHIGGEHSDIAKNCKYLDPERSDGAILVSNADGVGRWYSYKEIDRPQVYSEWVTIEAHACHCKCENECPVAIAREKKINELVEDIWSRGVRYSFHCERILYHYHMAKINPLPYPYPTECGVPREYYYEVMEKLSARLDGVDWWKY